MKKPTNPRLTLGLGLFLLFMLTAGVSYGLFSLQSSENNGVTSDGPLTQAELKKRMNVLLLAIDKRPGENTGRTDTMILASIDRQDKKVFLLSIPRDTRVKIDGHGLDKINSAHMYGGVPLAEKTVEDLLGIPVDYYVKTDFDGFREIVETLGGVEIDVEKNMYHNEGDSEDLINLKKGVQTLNGKEALQYVRFRSDELGDISRTQRQQKFLQALAKSALQMNTVWKLPALVPQLSKVVETDLGVGDMVSLAMMAKDWKSENIIAHTLPGNFMTLNGISYWYVDPSKAKQAALDFMRGIITTKVIDEGTVVLEEKPRVKSDDSEKADDKKADEKADPSTASDGKKTTGEGSLKPGTSNGKTDSLNGKASPENPLNPKNPKAPSSNQSTTGNHSTGSVTNPQNNSSGYPDINIPSTGTPSTNNPAAGNSVEPTNPSTAAPNRVIPGAPPVPSGVQSPDSGL
ncbi:LytR family transcriptional regulator [Heliobacillus mobilis]|uniref:LytR family transcriptional regulator n=1 Tax=Heliobacterium mobile TaxID=28064 RepID=A0A6I3SGF1_HELMO|nr:LCP family protein [Heliobacterium mobile]MTV47903.1 LytR family transcriptional regulator [Heliobacterium mobile]